MSTRNITGTIQVRNDTAANWESKNPILKPGEIGYDTTNKETKIGDGVTHWDELEAFTTVRKTFEQASWSLINNVAARGKAKEYYKVGDEKTITLSTGEEVTLVIMGFDYDDLTNGGKAPISIAMKNLLATTYQMNPTETNVGGWGSSAMRNNTMPMLFNQLPSELQTIIKPVNKYTQAGNRNTSIVTTSDKLWLLSGNGGDEKDAYDYWKLPGVTRAKYLANGSGRDSSWWTRSPYWEYDYSFLSYHSNGSGISRATYSYGVCFGFCI